MIDTTADTFDSDVINRSGDQLVVAYFTAPWCVPCRMLRPRLEELEAEIEGLTIARVDADTDTSLANRFWVKSVPTLLLFRNGEEVENLTSTADKATLRKLFEDNL